MSQLPFCASPSNGKDAKNICETIDTRNIYKHAIANRSRDFDCEHHLWTKHVLTRFQEAFLPSPPDSESRRFQKRKKKDTHKRCSTQVSDTTVAYLTK